MGEVDRGLHRYGAVRLGQLELQFKITLRNVNLSYIVEQALLTLNSCPMFTFNERDLHRMPTPLRTHLPIKGYIAASNILDEDSGRDNEADIALLRLPAPSLRGTFAKAYSLLTKLTAQIGWDELLRTRSTVFVMEEEYRKHKAHASVDGDMTPRVADDNASVKGMRSPRPMMHINTNLGSANDDDQLEVPQTPIPTIKISSESDHEREHAALKKMGISANGAPDSVPSPVPEEREEDVQKSLASDIPAGPEITKPEQIQPAAEDRKASDSTGEAASAADVGPTDQEDTGSSFNNKRLCERWLDNLFMSLYEVSWVPYPRTGLEFAELLGLALQDLRVYTIWRAEISHFKTQHMSYRKTGTEVSLPEGCCLTEIKLNRSTPIVGDLGRASAEIASQGGS